MQRTASFSRCKTYRYQLGRQWDDAKQTVAFIGLNPSTADHKVDDPTIRRCIGFAKSWGFGGLVIVNLFAYRTPYPNELKAAQDPIGPRNSYYLNKILKNTALQVAIWGNDGEFLGQADRVRKRCKTLHAIRINNSGQPAHPLYLKKGLSPVLWVN